MEADHRYRPVCELCGFEDTATFTAMQLDVYDFDCPTCPGGGYIQHRLEVMAAGTPRPHGSE